MNKQYTQKSAIQYREDRPTKGERKNATQKQRTADARNIRRELQNWDKPELEAEDEYA